MGFRFRKSKKIGPFRITASKSGVSYSVGGKGYRLTKQANGKVRQTYSIPGTGISYSETVGSTKKKQKKPRIPGYAPPSNQSGNRDGHSAPTGPKKHRNKLPIIIAVAIVLLFSSCVAALSGEDDPSTPAAASTSAVSSEPVEATTSAASSASASSVTPAESDPETSKTDSKEEEPATTTIKTDSDDKATSEKTESAETTPDETEAEPEPAAPAATQKTEDTTETETRVWIPTNGGAKYHSNPGCSSMKNPKEVTISEAERQGFTPCGRCY